jgi:hypothetical protein
MSPRAGIVIVAGAAVALVVGFFYLLNVADGVDPQRAEKRIELPGAFSN